MEEFQDDNINNDMEEQDLDSNAMNQNMLLQSKENQIKQLKRKIEAFEKNAEEQNQKLSDYDHLLVEFNSINSNYTQMQQDLDLIKAEIFSILSKYSSITFNVSFSLFKLLL